MASLPGKLLRALWASTRTTRIAVAATATTVAIVLGAAAWWLRGTHVGLSHTSRIDITPVQIERIRSIGEWEFLSISDEELVDTVRHGFFGDDGLARIYYGTLRLGFDLGEVQEGWIRMDHDTVSVTLPPVRLLDERFLDEARTRSFYEDGRWTEADRARLTRRAEAAMRDRCLTPANIASAERQAAAQMSQLLRAMGFAQVRVRFAPRDGKK